jgi:hypothetical protein
VTGRWPGVLRAARLENVSTNHTNHTNGPRGLRSLESGVDMESRALPRAGRVRVVRGPSIAALAATAALAACAPKGEAPQPGPVGLNCALPFQTLKAQIVGQPGLVPAPKDPNEPYRFYSMADGRTSYLITEPGAPGHPAILMQKSQGTGVVTSGCPYGDRKGYAEVTAYLNSLSSWRRK